MVCGRALFLRNFVTPARWQDAKEREAYVKVAVIGTRGAAFHLRGFMVALFVVFFLALQNRTQERFC
jgi:hypothetical protein